MKGKIVTYSVGLIALGGIIAFCIYFAEVVIQHANEQPHVLEHYTGMGTGDGHLPAHKQPSSSPIDDSDTANDEQDPYAQELATEINLAIESILQEYVDIDLNTYTPLDSATLKEDYAPLYEAIDDYEETLHANAWSRVYMHESTTHAYMYVQHDQQTNVYEWEQAAGQQDQQWQLSTVHTITVNN